jgi:hypothetical protein
MPQFRKHFNVTGNLKPPQIVSRYRLRKVLITVLALFVVIFVFYKLMTYDRNYTWTKELNEQVTIAFKGTRFNISKTDSVNIDKIKLPTEREIKIKIQKGLSKLGLMSFKAWCLSDHLIGIEIEYKNVDTAVLQLIKERLEHQFENYEIVWTEI